MGTATIPSVDKLSFWEGLRVLGRLRKGLSGLAEALQLLHQRLGEVFEVRWGRFRLVVVAHPSFLRQALVEKREAFAWRVGDEPIVRLLRRGFLVMDGAEHAALRAVHERSNRRRHLLPRLEGFYTLVDRVTQSWQPGHTYDMRVEMRKLALLAFEKVYFSHDVAPELSVLWKPILAAIQYIGPGLWLVTGPKDPPPEVEVLDRHFYRLIQARRETSNPPDDMLTHLIQAYEDDELIRDQMLTMFIAGHDTSTAALAWSLYLLAEYPIYQHLLRTEVRDTLGDHPPNPTNLASLVYLDAFVKEVLRLYPPIHAGNRRIVAPVEIGGYPLTLGTRVLLSYYLVHRHPNFWAEPERFWPERWQQGGPSETFAYVPFSGGPRMCIGAPFAQLELRLVLARLLQRYRFERNGRPPHPYMGATLEPHPAVPLQVQTV
ncbi:MAG: cytochrome P450 [Bacteroidetes bacterium]|nr:MAG: cytochrome P450 [Bacteroidota bacterium]